MDTAVTFCLHGRQCSALPVRSVIVVRYALDRSTAVVALTVPAASDRHQHVSVLGDQGIATDFHLRAVHLLFYREAILRNQATPPSLRRAACPNNKAITIAIPFIPRRLYLLQEATSKFQKCKFPRNTFSTEVLICSRYCGDPTLFPSPYHSSLQNERRIQHQEVTCSISWHPEELHCKRRQPPWLSSIDEIVSTPCIGHSLWQRRQQSSPARGSDQSVAKRVL